MNAGARRFPRPRRRRSTVPVVRDGLPYPPGHAWRSSTIYEDVPAGCARLKAAGFLLVVATNQPDVGRGTQSREIVEAIHAAMRAALPGNRPRGECPSTPAAPAPPPPAANPRRACCSTPPTPWASRCRAAFMVGDRWRDIDCGHAAGCATVFIDRGYRESLRQPPDFTWWVRLRRR